MSMVGQRRDQSVVALGRSGTGKTTLCQAFAQELLKHAGTAGENFTCEFIFHTLMHTWSKMCTSAKSTYCLG